VDELPAVATLFAVTGEDRADDPPERPEKAAQQAAHTGLALRLPDEIANKPEQTPQEDKLHL